jgi:hypothetical protein
VDVVVSDSQVDIHVDKFSDVGIHRVLFK